MRLYSTLARDLVDLPEPPGPIGMYVCGPTVYARAHIGNARPYVLGCWYKRWLRERGYEVKLIHNITDVNDKIYEAAPGASAERARQATEWYLEDTGRFGLDEVDHWPKVTDSMEAIVSFIAELVERDFAYAVDGDVYFRVARWEEYGRLSGQKPDQVEEQEPNPRKEDPRDFALWKANKPDEDTWWESPWGRGRPGWHIECSAMAEALLGPAFEIHGGGLDLVFPHHENELAQSRARGYEFAKIWMHNGMLRFTGEKMSKSLGNVETIKEAFERPELQGDTSREPGRARDVLLLFFLKAHWRRPIDYSDMTLGQSLGQWATFRNALANEAPPQESRGWDAFVDVLDDDFNTPEALALMNEWASTRQRELLRRALDLFGVRMEQGVRHEVTLGGSITLTGTVSTALFRGEIPDEIKQLAAARYQARQNSDFARADAIRDAIEAAGFEMRDVPNGYELERRV
jgi:cysteinyl-tRNA synthetase